MFFCNKCGSMYEISNDVKYTLQHGGNQNKTEKKVPKIDIKNIIDKILNVEENKDKDSIFDPEDGIEYLDEMDVLNNSEFKKLDIDKATLVINKLNIYLPKIKKKIYKKNNVGLDKDNKAYFVCINCSNFEPIKEGTLIFSQSNSINNNNFDLTLCANNMYDMTLPRDRNYTCPNDKCISHKEIDKKEQVTKRYRNSQKLVHTCCACATVWAT
jgi:hypothetical protein